MPNSEDTLITRFSLAFSNKARVTFLLAVFLLGGGYVAYSKLLKREGFPAIQVPFVMVQTGYFVNNAEDVQNNITLPIEDSLADLEGVKQISSTTGANFSSVIIEFEDGTPVKQARNDVRDEIAREVELPELAKLEVQTFNAGTFDGEHDFILTVTNNRPIEQLQDDAQKLADELSGLSHVGKVEVIKLITRETNPATGEEFNNQSSFNRVGYRQNGQMVFKPAVAIGVAKKADAGSIEVSEQIRAKVNEMRDQQKLHGLTVVYGADFATSLKEQISSLEESAALAIAIIAAVLLLFINWRSSLVMVLSLPLTMGAVFISLYLVGYTLNVISLFALILVLGIFVDDGIIVVEAIDYYRSRGFSAYESVRQAVNDIGLADISGTLTTMLVFVPMLFITGILGDFIILIPVTVMLAMGLSVLLALTVLPLLSNFILRPNSFSVFGGLVNKADNYLGRFTEVYLKKKWRIAAAIVLSIIVIMAGSSLASQLQFTVFPAPDDSQEMSWSLSFPPGTTIEQAEETTRRAEQVLSETLGSDLKMVTYYSANGSGSQASLKLSENRQRKAAEIAEAINQRFENFDGAEAKAGIVSAGPPTEEYPFKMQLYADNSDTLEKGLREVESFVASQTFEGEQRVTATRLSDPAFINRVDHRRYGQVSAKLAVANDTAAILELQERIEKEFDADRLKSLGLADDALGFDFGQESENLESFQSAIVAFGVAIILIYLLLLLQFNSFSQPLLVLLALPFALPGVFFGLWVTDNSLGFFSMLGIIALAGVVVNNTIMLMEYANHERAKGSSYKQAIVDALRIRFRPVLTTSVTTICALLPLGLSDPFWEGLTFTMIFGLAASVILVLTVFPAYYVVIEGFRHWLHNKFKRKEA